MIYVGIAIGVSISFLAMIFGMAAIGYSVARERAQKSESEKRLFAYWEAAESHMEQQVAAIYHIAETIRERT